MPQELRDALRRGTSLHELWKVARGEIKYKDWVSSQNGNGKAAAVTLPVPENLVGFLDIFIHVYFILRI